MCEINPKTPSLDEEFVYIDLESVEKGTILHENVISRDDAPSRAQRVLKFNDILFQCVRPYQKNNLLFSGDTHTLQYVASTGYAQIRTDKQNPAFLYQLLNTQKFVDQVMLRCTGTSYPAINANDLSKIPICYPLQIEEQNKIAKLLSLLDNRIETQKKVIEDLKRLKYAISKRVFAEMGQHHPVVKLGELCSIKTGKLDANAMIDNGEFPFFTCAREDFRTDTYAFEGDSLLISGNGDIGIVKRYNGKFNAYQRTYVLQDFIQEIAYVQCFVEHHLPKRVLKEKNIGAMPYIVLSTLSEMPIILPPTYIQNAICKTIGAISEQINIEEKILANFELQKQYNLSMMFI